MAIKYKIFFLTVFLSVLIDQLSKYLIMNFLADTGSFNIFRHFSLTLVKNTGISFGMFSNLSLVNIIIIVSFIAATGIFLYFRRYIKDKLSTIAFGLIEGGIIGNLIDRIRIGAVIDFIDFHIWPVFNFADTFIVAGVMIILFKEFKKEKNASGVS